MDFEEWLKSDEAKNDIKDITAEIPYTINTAF